MKRSQPWLFVVLAGALIGLVFAGVSSYDFIQHLDRQVHSLHCSFIPGGTHAGADSGCQAAMMSPYSSVLRSHLWGGIPISLPAMSVFAFLLFYAADLLVTRRKTDARATGFLVLASALPVIASIVMLTLSLTKLGTVCKVCVGIYTASALTAIGAVGAWRRAVGAPGAPWNSEGALPPPARGNGVLGAMFAIGVAFVALPLVLYLVMVPDHAKFIGTCDTLAKPDDTYNVMFPIGPSRHSATAAPAIEIFDPLCPACRAFEERLEGTGLDDELARRAVLFPLDNTCNWMVTEATHPGACTVSEAILCAQKDEPARTEDVITWAFAEQDRIREAAKTDPAATARIVKEKFPELASCVGSPDARSRLNKSMRWVVANNIRVLTPQLFVDNVKLCDEDVDLGLDYTLSVMLARHANHTLAPAQAEKAGKP